MADLEPSSYTGRLASCLRAAVEGDPLFAHPSLTGYSGLKVIGLLQRLARLAESEGGGCYAEIGVYQGLTLLSVAGAVPRLPCFGIDNFSQFDPARSNRQLIAARQQELGLDNVQLLDQDYEEALRGFGRAAGDRKIALLFVDGPHDYRSQLLCLLLAQPLLADRAIVVVDDCNYEQVRLATRDALVLRGGFRLVFEAYTAAHPSNVDKETEQAMRSGWWNGVHVLARGVDDSWPGQVFPDTGLARARCEREHVLHAHGLESHLLALGDATYDLLRRYSVRSLYRYLTLLRRIRTEVRRPGVHRRGNVAVPWVGPREHSRGGD